MTFVRRHLGTEPLPSDAWASAVTATWTPEADRSPAQVAAVALAASLPDELAAADAVLLAVAPLTPVSQPVWPVGRAPIREPARHPASTSARPPPLGPRGGRHRRVLVAQCGAVLAM